MSETLFLELPRQTSDEEVRWCLTNAQGEAVRDGGADDLPELLIDFDGEVVTLTPTSDVLRTSARVPSRRRRQLVQAVPFAVEEQLGEEVENYFFALGDRAADGALPVLAVARSRIEGWVARLRELGVTSRVMLPPSELVPFGEGINVLVMDDRAVIRYASGAVLETSIKELPMGIALAPEERRQPIRIHVSKAQSRELELQLNELTAAEDTAPELITFPGSARDWLHQRYLSGGGIRPINLLQGEYRVEPKRKKRDSSVWRPAAALAAAAVALHLLTLLGQGLYLSYQANDYRQAALEVYRGVFPNDPNPRTPLRNWDARLGQTGNTGVGFPALLAQAASQLGDAGITLGSVNYNESRGDLIMEVVAARSEMLVAYSQALIEQGLLAEIGTINQEGNSVRGSIKVSLGGA